MNGSSKGPSTMYRRNTGLSYKTHVDCSDYISEWFVERREVRCYQLCESCENVKFSKNRILRLNVLWGFYTPLRKVNKINREGNVTRTPATGI